MFRNNFLLRVEPPTPSFLLLRLTLSLPAPDSSSLQSLCWRLSRSFRLACISQPPDIFVVYQRSQSESAELAIRELSESLPICDVSAVEEMTSGISASLIAKAVDCALRSFLMEEGKWICLGNNCIVLSDFGCNDEGIYLHALHLEVRADVNNSFTFLVSPDVIHFKRYKIPDLVGANVLQTFNDGEEIVVADSIHERLCSVLPSLCEGHIIGLRRSFPNGRDFEHMEQLWFYKHGLAVPSECFMKIWLNLGGASDFQWFPSAFVLRGGLIVAPHSVRVPKANETLALFLKILEVWNFFGGIPLKIKGACRLPTGPQLPGWTKASNNNNLSIEMGGNNAASILKYNNIKVSCFLPQLSAIDFRTPKPAVGTKFIVESSDQPFVKKNAIESGDSVLTHELPHPAVPEATKVRLKPIFISHAHARRNFHPDKIISGNSPLPPARGTDMIHENVSLNERSDNYKQDSEKQTYDEALAKNISESVLSKDKPQQVVNKSSPLVLEVEKTRSEEEVVSRKVITKDTVVSRKVQIKIRGQLLTNKRAKQQTDSSSNNSTAKVTLPLGHDLPVKKKRAKQQVDPSDATAKVMACHAKGQLGTLSVLELKCYLSTIKAKLSGKKDDLIQRIISLLS